MTERLDSASEQIIDPRQPIIDAHHHLWHKPGSHYLFPELLADLSTGHDIRATVYVEGGSLTRERGAGGTMYRADGPIEEAPLGEVEFANGVAAMAASGAFGPARAAASIVAFADLRRGEGIRPVLERYAGYDRVKGVRYIAGWNDDPKLRRADATLEPDLLIRPDFRAGMAVLRDLGLSFETTILHYQIEQLVDAARAFPDLRMAICHVGGPYRIGPYAGKSAEAFGEWKTAMRALAELPNVSVKLGGLAQPHTALTPAAGSTTAAIAAMWHDHIATAIDLFGPARCMFESNTPVDTRHVPYRQLWNVFKTLASGYSGAERDQLFWGTASQFYALPLPGAAEIA